MTATLDGFEFPRYLDDLFVQRRQQHSRLRRSDLFRQLGASHSALRMFSSNRSERAP